MRIDQEFKNLIPELTTEEFRQLEENILAEGCRENLIVWGDILIDGHNRFEICTKHGLEYKTANKDFVSRDKVIEWIILNQFGRRNLSSYDRSVLALRLKDVFAEKAKENQLATLKQNTVGQKSDERKEPVSTKKELAKVAGVSHDTIAKVQKIEEKATPEIKQKVKSGDISINKAYSSIKKEERKADIQQQKKDIEEGKAVLPEGLFEVLSVDPPWNYGTPYDPDGRRVANPYPEMTQDQLKNLPIPSTDNSVLFLWTTHRFIWDAKELLDLWGFEYRSTIVWDKDKIGMGDLFRMQCEFCLVGIKGKPVFDNNNTWRDIIREPRREHSRKPETFYEMVDHLCVGRKLDYFSRGGRQGWETFGNDDGRFSNG